VRARGLALVLFAGALATACEGRPRPTDGKEAAPPKPRGGPAVMVFDLSAGVPEQEKTSILAAPKKRSFDDLVDAIDEAAKDKDAKAFFVRFGGASLGMARAEEIGGLFEAVRTSGKPVVCHADGFTNSTMLAAARGCSKLYVSPAGEVETIGIAAQIVYMRKLLADELKISIDILQVGKFKGAEEPLTRDGPSDEARASLESTLADMRKSWLDGIVQGRGSLLAKPDVIEDGPYAPPRAKALGLVDEVGYADDALSDLKKSAGAPREDARFGGGAQDKPDDLGDIVRALAGGGGAPIALIRATGSISMAGGGGLLGGRSGITEKDLSRTLAKVERDPGIKALVLRIDSPGGSALASDLLWHDLMRIRKKKPIVVSVGEMAASGGYYLASTGSFIYADAGSIVGSIGVVGGKLAVGPALERFGVHTETFTGKGRDPQAANRAAYLSALVPWDEPTKVRIRETMTGIYDLFLSRVAEGRSTEGRSVTVQKVSESAEGRIFSGREGKARGLVDELGGLKDALARARALAKVPEDAGVQVMGSKGSFLEALDPSMEDAEERASALKQEARTSAWAALEDAAPDLAPFAASLVPLAEGERSVAAVPFALVVR
jgi:protease IV